jgi:hypothetical protein
LSYKLPFKAQTVISLAYKNIDSYRRWHGTITLIHHDSSLPKLMQLTGGSRVASTDLVKTPGSNDIEQELVAHGVKASQE